MPDGANKGAAVDARSGGGEDKSASRATGQGEDGFIVIELRTCTRMNRWL